MVVVVDSDLRQTWVAEATRTGSQGPRNKEGDARSDKQLSSVCTIEEVSRAVEGTKIRHEGEVDVRDKGYLRPFISLNIIERNGSRTLGMMTRRVTRDKASLFTKSHNPRPRLV